MKEVPPKARLHGTWVIDADRTTWSEAVPLLASKQIGPQRGCLRLKPDGRFVICDLPDFSFGCPTPIVASHDASGEWWTAVNESMGAAYVWLEYEEGKGEPVRHKSATLYIERAGNEHLLSAIIFDPDSGDVLVLRKSGNGED